MRCCEDVARADNGAATGPRVALREIRLEIDNPRHLGDDGRRAADYACLLRRGLRRNNSGDQSQRCDECYEKKATHNEHIV